jgi:hypothetical protein
MKKYERKLAGVLAFRAESPSFAPIGVKHVWGDKSWFWQVLAPVHLQDNAADFQMTRNESQNVWGKEVRQWTSWGADF